MTSEQIEQQKLELEREKVKGNLELRKLELEIRKAEIKKATWQNPILIGILAAFIGLVGNIWVSYHQGKNALEIEKTKNKNVQSEAKQKLQSNLIIEAIKTGDPESASKNLEFLIKVGLITDEENKISNYIADNQNVPVLPSANQITPLPKTVYGDDSAISIADLSASHELKNLVTPVGILEFGNRGVCTAFLVSKRHILTADYCGINIDANRDSVTIKFRNLSGQGFKTYRVKPAVVSLNEEYGYAILEVEGDPSKAFGVAKLANRDPVNGEPLFLVASRGSSNIFLLKDEDCKVTWLPKEKPFDFYHRCDSGPGGGGAPVFSANENTVIGIHYAKGSETKPMSTAKKISAILAKDDILKIPK